MEQGWSRRFRYFMLVVMLVVVVSLIAYFRAVLTPLIVSALVAYLMNSVAEFLSVKSRMPRRAVNGIVFILGLAVIVAVPALIVPVLIGEAQKLIADLDVILGNIQELLSRDFFVLGQVFQIGQFLPDLTDVLSEALSGLTLDAFEILEATTRNFLWFLVILASTYTLLRDWSKLREWFIALAPESSQDDVRRIYTEIKLIWRGYLRGNLALMLVTGILFTIAWLAIGVPAAVILGIIAGLLTIIPDLGPAIAAILAILVALVEGSVFLGISNFWFALLVLVVYLVLINIKNIWIRPRIFGRSVHMHDGLVFIAIVAAVVVEGVLGALIVIPVLASIGVIGRYIWNQILGIDPFPEPTWRKKIALEDVREDAAEENAVKFDI